MTRRLRERPRLVAAQLTLVVLLLGAAVLVGSALAGDNGDRETKLEQRLGQADQHQRDQDQQLARARAERARLARQLAALRRSAATRARAARVVRRELAATRRALRRARNR